MADRDAVLAFAQPARHEHEPRARHLDPLSDIVAVQSPALPLEHRRLCVGDKRELRERARSKLSAAPRPRNLKRRRERAPRRRERRCGKHHCHENRDEGDSYPTRRPAALERCGNRERRTRWLVAATAPALPAPPATGRRCVRWIVVTARGGGADLRPQSLDLRRQQLDRASGSPQLRYVGLRGQLSSPGGCLRKPRLVHARTIAASKPDRRGAIRGSTFADGNKLPSGTPTLCHGPAEPAAAIDRAASRTLPNRQRFRSRRTFATSGRKRVRP